VGSAAVSEPERTSEVKAVARSLAGIAVANRLPAPAEKYRPLAVLVESATTIAPWVQYRIARTDTAALAGAIALIAAAVAAIALLLPSDREVSRLTEELARARTAARSASAPQQPSLERLLDSLPTRASVPAVLTTILQQAQQAAVPLDVGHYTYVPPKNGDIGRYELEFPVKAAYPNIRDFIDRTLTAVPAATLDKLRIERKAVGDNVVNADVRLVLFVRDGGPRA